MRIRSHHKAISADSTASMKGGATGSDHGLCRPVERHSPTAGRARRRTHGDASVALTDGRAETCMAVSSYNQQDPHSPVEGVVRCHFEARKNFEDGHGYSEFLGISAPW